MAASPQYAGVSSVYGPAFTLLSAAIAPLTPAIPESSEEHPVIVATGPLTSDALTADIARLVAPMHIAEALECLGGNGFVEESGMPRLYREAPLNSIWEGSANVICLDVLRAFAREPGTWEVLLDEIGRLALALQGSLLVRSGHHALADAFCAARLAGDAGHVFGTLPTATPFAAILEAGSPRI